MRAHLTALLATLDERADQIAAKADACTDSRLAELCTRIKTHVGETKQGIAVLSGLPAPADDAAWRTRATWVGHASRRLDSIERLALPVLERHSEADARSTRLLAELLDQVGWRGSVPTVATLSQQYFMATPDLGIIFECAGEEERLLRIPDLAHEYGHCLCADHRADLHGDLASKLLDWVNQQGKSKPLDADFYDSVYEDWHARWLEEFTCDIIGTYLTGPSYAHQHLTLGVASGPGAFEHAASHPADDARALVIERALRLLGLEADADEFAVAWGDLVQITEFDPDERQSDEYEGRYPVHFRDLVVDRVCKGLQTLGFRHFDPDAAPDRSYLPGLVANAWQRYLADPGAYGQWERQQVESLFKQWGV